MPHIDDGTLNALLDGALRVDTPDRADAVEGHLETCADCRARLEHAAALRDDAADVLAALDADLTGAAAGVAGLDPRPDFQEVLARASVESGAGTDAGERTTDPGAADERAGIRRQYGWTRGLAWAATIVVALGTGYIVGDLAGPTGEVPRAARPSAEAAPADRAGDGDRSPERVAESVAQPTPVTVEEQAATEEPTARDAAERDAEALREPVEERRETASAAAEPEVEAPVTGTVEADADVDTRAEPTAELLNRAAAEAAAGGAITIGDVTAVSWTAASIEEAEARVGPLLVLPGAELTGTELAAGGDMARTRQRLPGGVEADVVQLPARARADEADAAPEAVAQTAPSPGAAPLELRAVQALAPSEAVPSLVGIDLDSAAATVSGPATIAVTLDGVLLTVTGPLPPDVLRALAATAAARGG